MSLRIAAVACLDESRSVHSVTFKRALAAWRRWLSIHDGGWDSITLETHDDGADPQQARTVAIDIIDSGVAAVVGHFSSAAAAAAAPLYADAGLPLFLPAATAGQLTANTTTFRLCDNDATYARFVLAYCRARGYRLARVDHDGSLHGRSVAAALSNPPASPREAVDAVLYSGNCQRSAAFLDSLDPHDTTPVLLTDDALAADIVAPARRRNGPTRVLGLASHPRGAAADWLLADHRAHHGCAPACYFWETIAALEVAAASAAQDPGAAAWPTVLGEIHFDARRETNRRAFAAYRVEAGSMRPDWTWA